ncbi:transport permease protein [Flexivirga endophytica]|uniref:Transport permease protein n=1 Tax=Flexivirga endophytica TaxID=1849103 RepID=A0A916SZ39_9MICO|nr:ABC transporter permease [Flexivirga endophytica]GGB23773.1 transport permease protein [Flexivirga endophytica]GHB57711.1 transport permease protein [Flexivirga endophytica]
MTVLDAEAPARPAGPVSASLTYARRSLLKIKHVPEQLGDVIGIPILFTLLFTYLFGGAVSGSTHDYLQYLLPGTLALAVVFVTIYSGVTLNRDLTTGAFDRFRSMPNWRPAPIVGALIGDVGRYLLAAGLVLGLGFLMGYRAHGGVLGVLFAVGLVVLFASALSWAWTTLGLLLRTPTAVMNLGFVILFPVTFVSNVFVAPDTMPGWLRNVAEANPISHLVTAARDLMDGTPAGHQAILVIGTAAVLIAVFAPLTTLLYQRRE